MNKLRTEARLLEMEISADKIQLRHYGVLLKKRLKHLEIACIASPIIIGGFMLGFHLLPSKKIPIEPTAETGVYFPTINKLLKQAQQLLGNFWLSFFFQTLTKSQHYNS